MARLSSSSLQLPRGEAAVLADSVRLGAACAGKRRVLAAYLLNDEQRSLIDSQLSEEGSVSISAADGQAFSFPWNANLIRALNMRAVWRPLREVPVHPLEVSSASSLPPRTNGLQDAVKALSAAIRRSGSRAVLLRLGEALSGAREAAAAASERAAQFDAAAHCTVVETSSISMPVTDGIRDSSATEKAKWVDFADRSIACLKNAEGFSHLRALGPRETRYANKTPRKLLDSMELSSVRVEAEAYLDIAATLLADDCVENDEKRCMTGNPYGASGNGDPCGISFVRPCVLHQQPSSQAAVAHAKLAAASQDRQAVANLQSHEERVSGVEVHPVEDLDAYAPRAWSDTLGGALPSRHDLPEEGNWVRLSVAQQVPASLPPKAAYRPSAHTTFGSEPRLSSSSRRWSYQTPLPFTKRGAHGAETRDKPSLGLHTRKSPGSFLPLRMAAAEEAHSRQMIRDSSQKATATRRGSLGKPTSSFDPPKQQLQAAKNLLGALDALIDPSALVEERDDRGLMVGISNGP